MKSFRLAGSLVGASILLLLCSGTVPASAEAPATNPSGEATPSPVSRVEIGQLVLEDIPEIPARISQDLLRYQSTRTAGFQGWLPDGQGILITTRFGETTQIHHVSEPGSTRRQLTFFAEPVTTATPSPSAARPGFLFPRDTGGTEDYEVFHFALDTGAIQKMSDGGRNGAPVWTGDGAHFAHFSTRGRDWNIELVTPGEGTRTVLEGQGAWVPSTFTPDNKHLLVVRLVSARENHPHLLDLESGELTPLPAGPGSSSSADFNFSPDGRWLYFKSNRDGNFQRLYRQALRGGTFQGEPESLTESLGWDIEGVALSPDGERLIFSVNAGGSNRLQMMRTSDGQELTLPELPDGRVRGLAFSPDGGHVGFQLETPRLAGDVYSIAMEPEGAGELVRWTYSETAGLPEDHFVQPTLIHYPTFDTVDGEPRRIPAIYYRPTGDGPHPVIVRIHGGPEGQSRPGFDANLQFWVRELGAAVILPNVRGSSGYGREYLQLDDGFKREDSVKDIGTLLDWIAEQPELDSNRVAVYGGSYGGYMVLASMIHFGDRLRAGVDIVGISNFVTFLENTRDYRRDLRRVEYGDERDPAMRAHLEKISPTARAQEIKKPLLIAQGLNDPRVPASESEQMVDEIRKSGGKVWYLLAKDEGHGFRKRGNRDHFQATVVHFFEQFLLGD